MIKEKSVEPSEQKQLEQKEESPSEENEGNSEKGQKEKPPSKENDKNPSNIAKDSLKGGIKKYQKALEKDDLGVKVASQGATKFYGSVKSVKKTSGKIKRKLTRFISSKHKVKLVFKKIATTPIKETIKGAAKGAAKKTIKGTAKGTIKGTTKGLKSGASKYQQQLEQGDEGVKLVSQSATKIAKTTKKLVKGSSKANAKLGKLDKQNSKLIPFSKKDKELKTESRTILKKKAIKKKMYAPQRAQNRAKALTGIVSNLKDQVATLFKSLNKFDLKNATKLVGTKIAAMFGGGLIGALPLIVVAALCLIIAGVLGAGSSQQEPKIGGNKNLSPEVEKWRSLVQQEAAAQGMESYINLLLAIIQVESGGTGTRDIMQSSESAGYSGPNVFQTEEESVRQGVKHLKECLLILKSFNKGYENNIKALAQAYNFGVAFARHVGNKGGEYSIEIAEDYSRTVVAPSLGNTTGITVPYVNETSIRVGKTYRYIDGGNFHYGELVSEYIGGAGANISGDFRKVLDEIEKYQGWPYVWGGKNPTQGFDCSGLTSWGLKQIGIDLPSYALSQYELTVPIDPSEAQPGDLIFFKGTYQSPDHISHVGFYIDENTMYDSQNAGIGYHDWKTPYWQQHFAGIHRIKR